MSNRKGGTSITIRNGGDPGGIMHRMVPQVTVKQTKTRRSKKTAKSTQQCTGDIPISTDSNCKKTYQPDSKTKQANDTGSSSCTLTQPKTVKVGGGSGSKPSYGSTSMKRKTVKVGGGGESKPSNGYTSMKPKTFKVGGGGGSKPSNGCTSLKPKIAKVAGGSGSKPSNGGTSMEPKIVKVVGGSGSKPSNGSTLMKPKAVKLCGGSWDANNDMDTNVCESVYKNGTKKKRRKRSKKSKKKMIHELAENAKERKRTQCQQSEELLLEAEPLDDMFTMDDHNVKEMCFDSATSDVRLAYELTRLTYQSISRNLVHNQFSATNWFDSVIVDAENKQNDVRNIEANHDLETMSNGYWQYKHIAELFLQGSLCAHHLLFANLDDSENNSI